VLVHKKAVKLRLTLCWDLVKQKMMNMKMTEKKMKILAVLEEEEAEEEEEEEVVEVVKISSEETT
jgi:hypothetical protein